MFSVIYGNLTFFLACFLSIYLLTYFSSCRLTRTSLIAAVTLTYTVLDTVFADERTRMVYVHPLIHYCNSTPSLQGRRGTQTAAAEVRPGAGLAVPGHRIFLSGALFM